MEIEHIAMYVNDLEKTRKFFMNYLGAQSNDMYHNKNTGFKSYFLSFEDGARLEIMNKPIMEDEDKTLTESVKGKMQMDTLIYGGTANAHQSTIKKNYEYFKKKLNREGIGKVR